MAAKKRPARRVHWSKEKTAFLEENYPELSLAEIAQHIGIPIENIIRKAQKLGMSIKRESKPRPQYGDAWVRIDWQCRTCKYGHLSGNIPVKDLPYFEKLWKKVHGKHGKKGRR